MKTYFLYRRKYGKRRYESEACCEVAASSLNEAKKRFVQQGFTGGFLIRGRCKDGEPFACNYTVTLRESKEKERRNMKIQIDKLDAMLKEAGIPFERNDDMYPDIPLYESIGMRRIKYPRKGYECVCSVIQGKYSHGGDQNLLEIMGLLTKEEEACDSVKGWLTAEEVFGRIKKHWDAKKEKMQ